MASRKIPRPAELKILVVLILVSVVWNAFRCFQALIHQDVIGAYLSAPGYLYLSLSGGFWALVGVVVSLLAWSGLPPAWAALVASFTLYGIWSGLDRFIIQNPHGNETFTGIASLIMWAFVLMLVFSEDIRDFYGRRSKI